MNDSRQRVQKPYTAAMKTRTTLLTGKRKEL